MLVGFALLVLIVVVAALAAALARRTSNDRRSAEAPPFRAKPVLTAREQQAFYRLRSALPSYVILGQVQLTQLLKSTASDQKTRLAWHNRISQLSVDLVVCKPDSTPIAVIELDDRSHDRPKQQERDRKKDQVLGAAGIAVFRWNAAQLPSQEQIVHALAVIEKQPADLVAAPAIAAKLRS